MVHYELIQSACPKTVFFIIESNLRSSLRVETLFTNCSRTQFFHNKNQKKKKNKWKKKKIRNKEQISDKECVCVCVYQSSEVQLKVQMI